MGDQKCNCHVAGSSCRDGVDEFSLQMRFGVLQEETRVTDPVTGGQKGTKLERFDLIPPAAMEEVARVYGRGANKYADRNWELGYNWGLSIAALERHLSLFKQRESRDELGNHHLACVVFHALALMAFEKFARGTDDRTTLREDDSE